MFARIKYQWRLIKHYRYLKKWRNKSRSHFSDEALWHMAKLHVKQFHPSKTYETGYMEDMK